MTIIEIENNLNNLVSNFDENSFVFDLLLAYGTPKSTIKRLQGSDHDKLSSNYKPIAQKKLFTKSDYEKLFFYDIFQFQNILQNQKDKITKLAFSIFYEREKHSQKTLVQLYNPYKMPEGLRKALHVLNRAIEQCCHAKPFESDEERLEYL